MRVIAQGAEAVIRKGTWHNRPVIVKERIPKGYRSPELDGRLRASRMKAEAHLMHQARLAGVRTPIIYDIDMENASMTMEYLDGPTAKQLLDSSPEREELAGIIGRRIGALHRAGIVHGDLTTSNIIFLGGEPCFIDFGLGEMSREAEKQGVDMHLVREAMSSAHSEYPGLFDALADGYAEVNPGGRGILALVGDIEKRGRYT